MYVDVTYTFHCTVDGCDVTETQHAEHIPWFAAAALPLPSPPAGWVEVGVMFFCPKHRLLLSVDGHEQEVLA